MTGFLLGLRDRLVAWHARLLPARGRRHRPVIGLGVWPQELTDPIRVKAPDLPSPDYDTRPLERAS